MSTERTFKRDRTPHYDSIVGVGIRLHSARTRAGLSQRDLKFPGCSAAYISRIERGERMPSLQVMTVLVEKLNAALSDVDAITVSWLQYGRETIDPGVAKALQRISEATNGASDKIVEAYKGLASAARKAAKAAEEG